MGDAKYAQIAAVMELARRALAEEMKARDSLTSPAAVRGYLRLHMQDLGHESFYCVFLDAQNRVIAASELFRGTLTQTSVYPREVVKHALGHNAAAVILAHNHPSRRRRAQHPGPVAHPHAGGGARAGGHQGAGPLHRGAGGVPVLRGARAALAADQFDLEVGEIEADLAVAERPRC